MKQKAKLSVVISAYNEEKKIEECMESVKWTDEIILINSSSTDKTVDKAEKYTQKIFTRDNNPMLNVNKNFGFSKASGDWILSLDADERVTPELKEEIEFVLDQDSEINGYWIPRKNIILGKWIEHAGWYPDYQLRLFKKNKGKFPQMHVHEMVEVDGQTENLTKNLVHYNYESIFQFIQKMNLIYVPSEAEALIKKDYKFDYLDAIRFPLKEFLSRFFAREGYKDGFHGFMLSILMAFYHFVIFASIWEKQGFKEIEDPNLLKNIEKEILISKKDILFWFRDEKVKSASNILKKIMLKAKHRLER